VDELELGDVDGDGRSELVVFERDCAHGGMDGGPRLVVMTDDGTGPRALALPETIAGQRTGFHIHPVEVWWLDEDVADDVPFSGLVIGWARDLELGTYEEDSVHYTVLREHDGVLTADAPPPDFAP
jgi:hypothetical protein